MKNSEKSRQELIKEMENLKKRIQDLEVYEHQLYTAQKELNMSRSKIDTLWAGNLGRWEWDYKTGEVSYNKKKIESLGYKEGEINPDVWGFTEMLHPDDYEATMQNMRDHLEGKIDAYEVEYRIRTKAGDYKWFYDRGVVTERTPEGKPLKIIGIVFDISERKEAEIAIKKSEERYRMLADNVIDVIILHDIEGNIEYHSPSLDFLLGYYSLENEYENWYDFIHGNDLLQVRQKFLRLLEQKTLSRMEYRVKKSDGIYIWVETISKIFRTDKGEETDKIISVTRDITERKKFEESLRNYQIELQAQNAELKRIQNDLEISRNKYFHLFELAPVGYFTFGIDTKILDVNITAADILKSFKTALLNKHFNTFILPEYQDAFYFHLQKAIDTKELQTLEIELCSAADEIIFAQIESIAIDDVKNDSSLIHSAMLNITDRKKAETALKESEKLLKEANAAKDKFFSIIAHDLRSPYTAILGLTDIIVNEPDMEKSEMYDLIKRVHKSQKAQYELLEDLLNWARAQTGRLKINIQEFDLYEKAFNSLYIFGKSAEAKEIELINNIPVDTIVKADTKMIDTVFRNLISNAVKFTEPGGKIEMYIENEDNERVEAVVKDNGVGIEQENIEKLFRIDVQFTKPGTDKEKGTGLGLILCKDFVEKNGGEIWVESEVGKGTVFHFTINK